jgi:peptidoglycan/LPS O-acetylase OafA/YrhL
MVTEHTSGPPGSGRERLAVLDGWRAISILLVLATHMLPLGPKWMQLNSTAGPAGMSLFFTLSGFLITSTLLRNSGVLPFFVRRLSRIVPLALVSATLILLIQSAPWRVYPPLLLYYWNYFPSTDEVSHVGHFWSLSVEMHFYLFVGLLVAVAGIRGLLLLPILAIGITALRISDGVYISISTHYRVDEILAGAVLAMCFSGTVGRFGSAVAAVLRRVPLLLLLAAFGLSCHPASGPIQYLRPYLGAAVVGSTLYVQGWYSPLLASRPLRYIAEVSYALYVIHPATMMGWLGSGDTFTRYLKRPLCFAITFGLAHLSTFYFERPLTELGKRLSRRVSPGEDRDRPRSQGSSLS